MSCHCLAGMTNPNCPIHGKPSGDSIEVVALKHIASMTGPKYRLENAAAVARFALKSTDHDGRG